MERVLPFDKSIIGQNTGYWCGPATVQNILSSRMRVDEGVLAKEMGTDQGGTDYVGLLKDALNRRLPQAKYKAVYLDKHDPPTQPEKDALWDALVRSISNGYGVATNWVSPPGNKPRGVKGSPNPRYSGGTTYHYVAAMGISDEGAGGRRSVLIADSGFWPGSYWVDFDQYASLITPKGYAFADLAPVGEDKPAPQPKPVIPPPQAAPVTPNMKLSDPKTVTVIIPNSYRPRNMPSPLWIACHTSESKSRVRNLNEFCRRNGVSYNRLVDDTDILESVKDSDAPWAAVNANRYAYHICWTNSFASWSREQWLDPTPGDGFNEREALRLGAKQIAYWIQQSHAAGRPIPVEWIGGRNIPPWGLNGITDHASFGAWGGGHSDTGVNFPKDTLLSDVRLFLTGQEQPPIVAPPPVGVPGTNPDRYADWMEYVGKPNPNSDRVRAIQRRLKMAYNAYAGHLEIDGSFGPLTRDAVRIFQTRSHLVADGIVGPLTAAALKP